MINKKMALIFLLFFVSIVGYSQISIMNMKKDFAPDDLPFERILSMTSDELTFVGFDYSPRKSMYRLKRHTKQTKRIKFSKSLNKRNAYDFEIYIYMSSVWGYAKDDKRRDKYKRSFKNDDKKEENKGKGVKKAIVQICFYDTGAYEAIKAWTKSGEKDRIVVNSGDNELTEFMHGENKVRLVKSLKHVDDSLVDDITYPIMSTVSDVSFATPLKVKSIDSTQEYYPIYVYTIFTSEEHSSSWLTKKQKKLFNKRSNPTTFSDIL